MKKFLCLITLFLLITGCATEKLSKTSFLGATEQNDICKEVQCEKYGLANEKVNSLAMECWEQELENLPPLFTKRQLNEIKPSVELCINYKVRTAPIISKSVFLHTIESKDFYDEYPKVSEYGISRLQINNTVVGCFEQEMETFPSEFSLKQLEEVEPDIKECASNRLKAKVKISKSTFIEILRQKELLSEIPESEELVELGVDMGEMQKILVDCFEEELPPSITISQYDELLPNLETCYMEKFETAPLIPKRFILKYVSQSDFYNEYQESAGYDVDKEAFEKIVISCLESQMQDLSPKMSYNQFRTLEARGPLVESCINAEVFDLSKK